MTWRRVAGPAWLNGLLLLVVVGISRGGEPPRGLWLTSRHDPANRARADVPGRMLTAPREVWRMATGGAVYYAREVQVGDGPAVLVQAGSNLLLQRWTGEVLWRQNRLGVSVVRRVDDFDGDGNREVLVSTGVRTVLLLDLASGEVLWTWQAAASTQINGHVFCPTGNGLRFVCFPSYGDDGWCFDFTGSRRQPRLLWHQSYAGKYGVGYGPSAVLADMDRDGRLDIVLSGKVPGVTQLVLDSETGSVKFEVHYEPEGTEGWGRPYGLLEATDLDEDGYPDLTMVSCQVEEYLAVARNVGGQALEKRWGRFVEKDWPTDRLELRPQVTSLADVDGDGRPELVVGLWDSETWRTAVIDPAVGFEAQRLTEPGWYFWGCHDLNGDRHPEIVVSREGKRWVSRSTTLAALDGKTLQPVAELPEAAIFASATTPLAANQAFMANRHNPVAVVADDGTAGILVRRFTGGRERGLALWGARPGGTVTTRDLAEPGYVRADTEGGRLLLTSATGAIQRCDEALRPTGSPLPVNGHGCQPLVWQVGGRRELVYEAAGGEVVGGTPDLPRRRGFTSSWRVAGTQPVLHVDATGMARLAVADSRDPDNLAAVIYGVANGRPREAARVPLDYPVRPSGGLLPFGDEFHLLVNLQTGVHTCQLRCFGPDGALLWADPASGAHPLPPSAGDLDGDGQYEVIADDHGALKVYGPDGGVLATDPGWYPAYSVQILGPFAAGGEALILRSSGIGGMSLIDRTGVTRWKTSSPIWRYSRSMAAVGDVAGEGKLMHGALAEDGVFECMDPLSGDLRWSLPLGCAVNGNPVVAGDLDGDGRDEFLVGTPTGKLLCLGEREAEGRRLWTKHFPAAVVATIIADVDGDGVAEITVSTADGYLRLLKER